VHDEARPDVTAAAAPQNRANPGDGPASPAPVPFRERRQIPPTNQPVATADGQPAPRRRAADGRPGEGGPRDARGNPQIEAAKIRLHELLIEELEHGSLEGLPAEQQREAVIRAAREIVAQEQIQLGGATRDELVEAVADEVLGLGPLEDASFDIADVNNTALLAARTGAHAPTVLYRVDLDTGRARALGVVGDGAPLRGLAIVP